MPTGTAVYLKGFTSKGEAYRPMEITTRSAYEQMYGVPDTEAERYTYAAACETLDQGGRLWMARLPYDNDAFEKMVGIKYSVKKDQEGMLSDNFYDVIDADSTIDNAAIIRPAQAPELYDLSQIDAFRADEERVPADSFLIVDTTLATYNRVTEDTRKGSKRELIGIIPVVTTAANGMLAQSLIQPDLSNYVKYESMQYDYAKCLRYGDNDQGLSSIDVVVPFNSSHLLSATEDTDNLSTLSAVYVDGQCEWVKTKFPPKSKVIEVLELSAEDSDPCAIGTTYKNYIPNSTQFKLDTLTLNETYLGDTTICVDTIAKLRTATDILIDRYHYSGLTTSTIGNIGNALFTLSAVSSDLALSDITDVPPFPEEYDSATIGSLARLAENMFRDLSASFSWSVNYNFKLKVHGYYKNPAVPQT